MGMTSEVRRKYDRDCATCAHRVERHPSKRHKPSMPRTKNYVCLVCARAIDEHGTAMRSGDFRTGETWWEQDLPCKAFDRERDEWFALDWKECE